MLIIINNNKLIIISIPMNSKHLPLIFLLSFLCSSLFAQSSKELPKIKLPANSQNELKFNAVLGLLSVPEISYERILSPKSSIGLSFGYTVDQSHIDLDFFVLPHYRYFFGRKGIASGFFLEGNLMYSQETSDYFQETLNQQKNHFGIGGAIGYKLLKGNGLVIDFMFGAGRYIIPSKAAYPTFPRLGVSVGKRFSDDLRYRDNLSSKSQNLNFKKNAIKLNLAHLAFGFPEITYERILRKSSSLGLSFSYSFNDRFDQNFFLIPHYRFYFGEEPVSGFFVELGAMLWQINNPSPSFEGKSEKIGFGGEFAIGWKFSKVQNYPIELVTGFGRSYINDEWFDRFMPRLGLSIGRGF